MHAGFACFNVRRVASNSFSTNDELYFLSIHNEWHTRMMNPGKQDKTNVLDSIAKAWFTSIAQLSHALATKMATLQLKQQALQKIFPSLLKGYHLAVEHHLMADEIDSKMLKRVDSIKNLDEQILPMFELLEQISHYARQTVHSDAMAIQTSSVQQCLAHLMTTQPFEQNAQYHFIKIDLSQDFELKYPVLFFDASIRHFLTAAWQRILQSGLGDIRIWVSNENGYHVFNIQETGQSWTPDQFVNLFDRFIFEYDDKTRPGLGFCRLAMLYIGGDIVCHAAHDKEGVHFKIMIPKNIKTVTCK